MPPLEPGVLQTLAKWRSANYSDIKYKLNITLERGAPLMNGTVEVTVRLTDEGAKNDLVLDWRTTQFQNDKDKPFAEVERVNERIVKESLQKGVFDYQINKEHLVISKKYLKTGENTLLIKFASPVKTSGAAITRYVDKEDGAEYVYSLFVPSDASTAFPVFDQPDLKARFQLDLVVPEKWNAVSNEEIVKMGFTTLDEKPFPPGQTKSRPGTLYIFSETKPISTYVFAFAAGDFVDIEQKRPIQSPPDVSTTIYVRKSQAKKFKAHEKEVFRLNRECVKFLESYFDYKFPFPKYDLVLIPEFPFGGMEHAGATFLREASIIFPTEPTKNDLVSRANLMFHEAAHQWFGDTVTMKWFDDLWLKEGFAEFMAYKTLEKVLPEYNSWKIFYERNKQAAYLTDSTKGTTPIYREIPNLSAAKSAYGNIVYRKAPSFLRQAEFYLGAKEFQTAVRAFLKKHEFANAEWTDLVKEFETASKQDLKVWANGWVKQRGLEVSTQRYGAGGYVSVYSPEKGGEHRPLLAYSLQSKSVPDENLKWLQKFKLLAIYKTLEDMAKPESEKQEIFPVVRKDVQTYNTNGSLGLTSLVERDSDILAVIPNYQDFGYGIFLLDEKSRAYVLANIQNEKDDFLRAMMWGSLWDSVREAELAPAEYVELVIKNINVETDEGTIQTLLGRVGTALNYYLPDKKREELAQRLETVLGEKMLSSNTLGQRLTFYRAYLNIASTERAAELLKVVLKVNNEATPEEIEYFKQNLDRHKGQFLSMSMPPLRAKDKFDIVTKLLVLGDKDAPKLLAELETKEKSDEAKRYAYAAKAGIAAPENKAKYWQDFTSNKELSESYIESAFVPFNSIRHSELTLPYLEKALAELPNLKRNRKIFFVNGWLGAFIGGQKSEAALNIVNKFLADNLQLDEDLRLKILENADNLERAIKIREKYGK